jgi:hypothetical protein
MALFLPPLLLFRGLSQLKSNSVVLFVFSPDICIEGTYETTTRVEANPPQGFPCEATETYIFEVTPPGTCNVDVEIECKLPDGTPCVDIESPNGLCTIGDSIDVIRFRVNPESCDDSQNSQDDISVCTDSNPVPAVGTNVRVTCVDGSNVIYGPNVVAVGDIITVQDPNGGPLPDSITCTITNGNGNTEYQEVSINTSGDVQLELKDTFGALEVEGCDAEGVEQNCPTEVEYAYDLCNTGDVDMEVTLFERTRNGVTEDLTYLVIAQLGDPPILVPGQCIVIEETEVIGKYIYTDAHFRKSDKYPFYSYSSLSNNIDISIIVL